MAISDDLVGKILALRGEVDSTILPEYEAAKKAVDDISAELKKLESLGKMTAAQGQSYAAIKGGAGTPGTLALAVEDLKNRESPAQVQQKTQASLQGLMDHLAAQAPHMKAATAAQYDSLKAAAFTGSDPQAQEDFKRFVGNLQTVPSKDIHKDLRKWVSEQLKTGVKVSMDDFAQKRKTLQEGETVMPGENPQLKQEYERATATGARRLRANFKGHLSSGGAEALGYAALNLGHEAGEYLSQPLTGNRYTAEARYRAGLDLIPGAAGLFGGLAGAFFGPGAAVAGAAGAAGLASAVVAPLSASSEKHEALRLASEDIALQMGRGTKAAGRFASMIETTAAKMSVPAAELAQSSAMIARSVSGFGAGGVALQARLQSQLGDNYAALAPAQAQYGAVPFTRGYREMLAGSVKPDAALFGDAAFYLAFTGDQDGYKKQLALQAAVKPPANYRQYVSDTQAAKPMGWWDATKETALSVIEGHPTAAIQDQRAARRRVRAFESTGQKQIADVAQQQKSDADFTVGIYEGSRAGRETALLGETMAQVPGKALAQSLASGRGLAGMKRYAGDELADLAVAQGGVQSQEALLRARLADKGLTDDRRRQLQYLLADTQGHGLDIKGQELDLRVGLFRQGISERQARFEGGYSRLGVGADELTLGGASAFDPRVARNVASRRAFLAGQSAYDLGLASDATNFLSPEEREQRRTSARREGFEARYALPNQLAVQKLGETSARSGERQAELRGGVARAQVQGGVLATLTAENRLIADQSRLRDELNLRLREGHLTTQQQLQVVTQIRDIDASTLTGRKQALDTAFSGLSDVAQARASVGASKGEREARLHGTSDTSYGQGAEGYRAGLQNVALLKAAAERTDISPDERVQRQAAYQRAQSDTERAHIEEVGTVQMGPQFDAEFTRRSHELSRQMKSPFAPGSVLQSNAALARMDQEKVAAIDAQARRVMSDPSMTVDQRRAAMVPLTEQREAAKDDLLDRQNSVDVGWMDRLTAMSVSAPSFASRLMPPADRVASIAEKRGLGQMSARVFGYNERSSYVSAATMGMLPSESNGRVFGNRPGDYPQGVGPNAYGPDGQGGFTGGDAFTGGPQGAGGVAVDALGAGSDGFMQPTGYYDRYTPRGGKPKYDFAGHLPPAGLDIYGDPLPQWHKFGTGPEAFGQGTGGNGPDAPVVAGTQGVAGMPGVGLAPVGADAGMGVTMQAAQILLQAAQMILQAAGTPHSLTVTQINPNTGQSAAHTQNTQGVNGAAQVMRGGAAQPPGAPAVGWYG